VPVIGIAREHLMGVVGQLGRPHRLVDFLPYQNIRGGIRLDACRSCVVVTVWMGLALWVQQCRLCEDIHMVQYEGAYII
jgi:hypothetical protein